MRLPILIASLSLIACAAGCGPSDGPDNGDAKARAEADTPGAPPNASAAHAQSAASTPGHAKYTTDNATLSAAAAANAAAAAADAAAQAANDAARAAGRDSVDDGDDAAWERERTALLLSVLVLDRRTGRPVVGASVDRGMTDASGRYEGRRPLPRPGEKIRVRCPSRIESVRTKLIAQAPFVVRDGRADATIEVDASVCVEPPVRSVRRRFKGLYSWGFEYSTFLPCEGMPAESSYYADAGSYWATLPDSISTAVDDAAPETKTTWRDGRRVYVEWLGTATGPGSYGHMGGALYKLEVEALYRVSATVPADCRPPELVKFPFAQPAPPAPSDPPG